MNKTLSKKQKLVLHFILEYQKKEKTAPSKKQIAEHMGVTPPAVDDKIMALQRKDILRYENGIYFLVMKNKIFNSNR